MRCKENGVDKTNVSMAYDYSLFTGLDQRLDVNYRGESKEILLVKIRSNRFAFLFFSFLFYQLNRKNDDDKKKNKKHIYTKLKLRIRLSIRHCCLIIYSLYSIPVRVRRRDQD